MSVNWQAFSHAHRDHYRSCNYTGERSLNYYDAHAPYFVPPNPAPPFGLRPEDWTDNQSLLYWEKRRHDEFFSGTGTRHITPREQVLARDGYDDCIAYIDKQLGNLLFELKRRRLLDNTLVIVTADHGESFGEHGLYGHFHSVHRTELDVPLVLVMPGRAPADRVLAEPVSLRDLPATVVDLLSLDGTAPFPGNSLARHWRADAPIPVESDPIYSELCEYGLRAIRSGPNVYIHAHDGIELLFDLTTDPLEMQNLAGVPAAQSTLESCRRLMAKVTTTTSSGTVGSRNKE